MAAEKLENNEVKNDYDVVPYISYPYPNTQPEHLYTVARLFNVDAVNPKKARVLEIGCASGGNIIPMAINFPESEFVGLDYSSVQIEEGNRHKEKLGLNNLEFKGESIADIDENLGKFDYIIVHGILSWVPKNIQDKIFEVCNNNLSDKGIAYISYNTLPGWGMVRSIREMMLYHTDKFTNPADKTREARMLLNFIKHGNGENSDSPYTKFIENEINTLSTNADSYLIHDHLEENNEPFYFHQFMEKANQNKLQYLGDSSVATMFIGNFPKETAEILKQVGNDIVRAEQYMDFIRNRRFRSSLLCKQGVQINRTVQGDKLKEFYVTLNAKVKGDIKDVDINSNVPVEFSGNSGNEFKVNDKYLITALLYMQEQGKAVNTKELIKVVEKRLGSNSNDEVLEKSLLSKMLVLLFSGNIEISYFEPRYITKVSDKPKTTDLVKYQATYTDWVTNQLSNKVNIDNFGRFVTQHLDGKNAIDDINKQMKERALKGELTLRDGGKKIEDEKKLEETINVLVKNTLEKMASSKILIS
jgi:methyltransferase-like protein